VAVDRTPNSSIEKPALQHRVTTYL